MHENGINKLVHGFRTCMHDNALAHARALSLHTRAKIMHYYIINILRNRAFTDILSHGKVTPRKPTIQQSETTTSLRQYTIENTLLHRW